VSKKRVGNLMKNIFCVIIPLLLFESATLAQKKIYIGASASYMLENDYYSKTGKEEKDF